MEQWEKRGEEYTTGSWLCTNPSWQSRTRVSHARPYLCVAIFCNQVYNNSNVKVGAGVCETNSLYSCMYVCIPAGELAQWFNSTQALPQPQYELEQLSELQGVLHRRESELAAKEDLLARKEEELSAAAVRLEEQGARTQQVEYERSSEERRRRKLEQAEHDLVSVRWGGGEGRVVREHGVMEKMEV